MRTEYVYLKMVAERDAANARAIAAEAREAKLREALDQIHTVCVDNAAPTVRHDMALGFVESIARAALEKTR